MTKDSHVIKRDGAARLGSPPSMRPPRPSTKREAESGGASFGPGYTDQSYSGTRDERKAFEAARGTPSPRQQEAQRTGPLDKPQPANPGDLEMLRQGILD